MSSHPNPPAPEAPLDVNRPALRIGLVALVASGLMTFGSTNLPPFREPGGVGRIANDLQLYLATSRLWLRGEDPRDCALLFDEVAGRYGGCAVSPAWLDVAFSPLAHLSDGPFPDAWTWLMLAAASLGAALWTWRARRPLLAAGGVLAAGYLLRGTLALNIHGNIESLVVLALGLAAAIPSTRGWLVAAAGLLKIQPWLIAPAGQRRPVVAAFVLMVATDLLIDGTPFAGPRLAAISEDHKFQPTLLGMIRLARHGATRTDLTDLALWALVVGLAVAWAWRRLRDQNTDTRFHVAVLGLLVLSPRGFAYVWLGAIGPVGLAWSRAPASLVGLLGLGASEELMPFVVAALTWVGLVATVRAEGGHEGIAPSESAPV